MVASEQERADHFAPLTFPQKKKVATCFDVSNTEGKREARRGALHNSLLTPGE